MRDIIGENSLNKFQNLLRTLFQFDSSDLDFGIYRILNYKRDQVEKFITKRLPQIVDQAFEQYTEESRKEIEAELEKKRREIRAVLGEDAFENGKPKSIFLGIPLVEQYLELEEKARTIQVTEELKTRVYNDLYTFFSRYYEDGDFISKRRYGRQESYAIPYNGEEVMLYWANRDQYYIKTGDRFKAYRFKVDDYSVAFELRNVAPEQNGNAGKKRYFVLAHEAPVTWNEQEKALVVAFAYRPLSEAEEKEHGRAEQQKPQDSLNEAAEKEILGLVPDVSFKSALARPEGTNGASLLRRHLTRFTRKNTADFFIHKDLGGFVRRELDFFLKNEVLLLDELIGGGEENLRQLVSLARVERQVAEAIIDFLAQIEDFQKRLWEKRKFVVRTEYCLTLDKILSIDEEAKRNALLTAIAANDAQWKEWEELGFFARSAGVSPATTASPAQDRLRDARLAFLCGRDDRVPTLVVDTRHFPEDFKWRLLAHFDDLDSALDGLLIKSENWQALNLLLEKYREKVKCIYIDPPYNTGSDDFLYKDRYQHSSWLSMMADRLLLAKQMMMEDALIFVSIDDRELERLRSLMGSLFSDSNKVAQITVKVKDPAGVGQQSIIFDISEYILVFARDIESARSYFVQYPVSELREVTEPLRGYRHWIASYGKKKLVKQVERPGVGTIKIYQWDGYEIRNADELDWEDYISNIEHIYADYNPSGGMILAIRDELPKCGLSSIEYIPLRGKSAGQLSTVYFLNRRILARASDVLVLKDGRVFRRSVLTNQWEVPNAALHVEGGVGLTSGKKPELLLLKIISSFCYERGLVLDFFAGSGTSSAVAHKTGRRWLAIDGDDTIFQMALKRMKHVLSGESSGVSKQVKWKGGGFFKYHYLEQYEDTLNNLELPREKDGQLAFGKFGDEYLLRYMLEFETQVSPSLLNLEMFKDPFAYCLKVQEGDEIVERPVDLVETFNYLLGIEVKKMRAFEDNGRPYRAVLGEKGGKRVVIVWRPVEGLEGDEEALRQDKAFIEGTVLPRLLGEAKPDRLLVNGASFVKDAEAIEPEFYRLMFAPVGA